MQTVHGINFVKHRHSLSTNSSADSSEGSSAGSSSDSRTLGERDMVGKVLRMFGLDVGQPWLKTQFKKAPFEFCGFGDKPSTIKGGKLGGGRGPAE